MTNPFKGIEILSVDPAPKACRRFALLMAAVMIFEVAGFTFWFPYKAILHIVGLCVSLLFVIGGGQKCNGLIAIFIAICGLNAFLLPIPPVFQSANRFLLFVLAMSVCSPLIQTSRAILFRKCLFNYFCIGISPLVIGSFFCFFGGINLMAYNVRYEGLISETMLNNYQSSGGTFSGLFGHSMMLGPLAAVVSLMFFVMYIQNKNKNLMAMSLIAMATTVLSASRAAVLCLVVAIMFIAFFMKGSGHIRKNIMAIGCIGAICMIPLSDQVFAGIINKQEKYEKNGSVNSREEKYDARIKEFSQDPLLGIGFASVDPRYDVYNPHSGQIEPGTSHLAVLAQTGLLGFVPYLMILFYSLKNTLDDRRLRAVFIGATFIALTIHMFFEGYVFGAGGVLCIFFWLTVAQAFDIHFNLDY